MRRSQVLNFKIHSLADQKVSEILVKVRSWNVFVWFCSFGNISPSFSVFVPGPWWWFHGWRPDVSQKGSSSNPSN